MLIESVLEFGAMAMTVIAEVERLGYAAQRGLQIPQDRVDRVAWPPSRRRR
ncbi:MAG: hypothetical protein U1F50_11235 [Rubrivivax sp.]